MRDGGWERGDLASRGVEVGSALVGTAFDTVVKPQKFSPLK